MQSLQLRDWDWGIPYIFLDLKSRKGVTGSNFENISHADFKSTCWRPSTSCHVEEWKEGSNLNSQSYWSKRDVEQTSIEQRGWIFIGRNWLNKWWQKENWNWTWTDCNWLGLMVRKWTERNPSFFWEYICDHIAPSGPGGYQIELELRPRMDKKFTRRTYTLSERPGPELPTPLVVVVDKLRSHDTFGEVSLWAWSKFKG